MLAERSRRTGPGSMVGSPVAEVVVVHVDEILLSNPGGRLRLSRCNADTQNTCIHIQRIFTDLDEACKPPLAYLGTGQNLRIEGFFDEKLLRFNTSSYWTLLEKPQRCGPTCVFLCTVYVMIGRHIAFQ